MLPLRADTPFIKALITPTLLVLGDCLCMFVHFLRVLARVIGLGLAAFNLPRIAVRLHASEGVEIAE